MVEEEYLVVYENEDGRQMVDEETRSSSPSGARINAEATPREGLTPVKIRKVPAKINPVTQRYLCLGCGTIFQHRGRQKQLQSCDCGNTFGSSGAIYSKSGDMREIVLLEDGELVGKKTTGISAPLYPLLYRMNTQDRVYRIGEALERVKTLGALLESVADVFDAEIRTVSALAGDNVGVIPVTEE